MEILKGFKNVVTLVLSFDHAGAHRRRNLAELAKCAQQVKSCTCDYIVPELLVLEFPFLFHFRGQCVCVLFHMQGMFAMLKFFLFAIKVVTDQEQSNGRSSSGRPY